MLITEQSLFSRLFLKSLFWLSKRQCHRNYIIMQSKVLTSLQFDLVFYLLIFYQGGKQEGEQELLLIF